MSLQSITDLIVHTKTPPSQCPVFTESLEQRTENPRVGNTAITAVNMHPEGFDLIGGFFMPDGFVWKGLFLSDVFILAISKNDYSPSVTENYMSSSVANIFYFGIEKAILERSPPPI